MSLTGQRTTADPSGATQTIRDVAKRIYNVEEGYNNRDAALTVLLNKLPGTRRVVKNTKFECFEEATRVRAGTCPGGADTVITTLTFDSTFGAQMEAGDIVYVPSTGERIQLQAVNTATYTATQCIRNMGAAMGGVEGTATAVIAATAEIKLAGIGFGEGTTAPPARSTLPEASYNFVQIFKQTTNMSGTLEQVALYGEPNTLEHRTKAMMDFMKVKINNAFWYGARREGTDLNGKPIRHTGGVFQHLKANNSLIADGVLTMKVLDAFAEKIFENGSDRRYLFGGLRFASCLDNLPRASVRVNDGVTSFGTDMREVKTNKGTFVFVLDNKIFEGEMATKVPALDLDSKTVQYAYLQNRDLTLKTHVESKKDDEAENLVFGEIGLYMYGYGLDHTLAASTGAQRGLHGLLYTNQTSWTY